MFNRALLISKRTRKARQLVLLAASFHLQESAVRFGRVSAKSGPYNYTYTYKDTPISPLDPPRRRHIPIWDLGGSGGGSAPQPEISGIFIDESLLKIPASEFPFKINLSERIHNVQGDTVLNILSITEATQSVRQTDFEDSLVYENPFFIAYEPQGNFLHTTLKVKFEVSDALRSATPEAISSGSTYASPSVPVIMQPPSSLPPTEGELCIQIIDDVLGDPEKENEYWNFQGNNGTCLIASVGSILESQGVATFEEVLQRVTVGVNSAGAYVVLDENQNPVLDRNGQWLLYGTRGYDNSTPDILRIDGRFAYVKFLETPGQGYRNQISDARGGITPRLEEVLKKGAIFPNPLLKQNWGWTEQIFDAYNVESHTGYASNFAEIIEELNAGNGIVAYIDAKELWNSKDNSLLARIIRSGWVPLDYARTVQNHAVWITGLDVSDPENPVMIINDSGDQDDGAGARYPLKDFIASFEDAEFVYQATGKPPNAPLQADRNSLVREVYDYYVDYYTDRGRDANDFCERVLAERFNEYLRNETLINLIDMQSPGFRDRVDAYKTAVEQNRVNVLEAVELDPDEIEKIFEEVDVE